jgi:AraC family transcriptional regulator of arabinose operon
MTKPAPIAPPSKGRLIAGLYHRKKWYRTQRAHGTQDWLLIYTLGGCGRFCHANGELLAKRGDIVLLRPGAPHDYGIESRLRQWDLLWAHFVPRPEWFSWLDWPEEAPGLMRLTISDAEIRHNIERRFTDVYRLSLRHLRMGDSFALNALEEVLLWCDSVNPRREEAGLDARIRRALDYLSQNFTQPVTLAALARHCGLSVSRLAHLFREQVGKTPQQFWELQRVNRARQLLEFTQHPVSEVAYEVGYQNPFYFSLRFKRHTGLSPRAYRRNHSKT